MWQIFSLIPFLRQGSGPELYAGRQPGLRKEPPGGAEVDPSTFLIQFLLFPKSRKAPEIPLHGCQTKRNSCQQCLLKQRPETVVQFEKVKNLIGKRKYTHIF